MSLKAALPWAGIQATVRMAIGLAVAKLGAFYLGPEGLALLGQLGSFIEVAYGGLGNAAGAAVVALGGPQGRSKAGFETLVGTAARVVAVLVTPCAVAIALLSPRLAAWLLRDAAYWPVFAASGLAIGLAALDTVASGALNALKQIPRLSQSSIGGALLALVAYAALVPWFGLWGALVGVLSGYVMRLPVTLAFLGASGELRLGTAITCFDHGVARKVLAFYPMVLVQAIASPLAQIGVRDQVIAALGTVSAGYLQAAWRLSELNLAVPQMALGMYFLALFASHDNERDKAVLLGKTLAQFSALTAASSTLLYLLREPLIRLAFTAEFLPSAELLPLQFAGDVCKIGSSPLLMALFAEQRYRTFFAAALMGPILFFLLTTEFLAHARMAAAPMAYMASNALTVVLLIMLRTTYLRRSMPLVRRS